MVPYRQFIFCFLSMFIPARYYNIFVFVLHQKCFCKDVCSIDSMHDKSFPLLSKNLLLFCLYIKYFCLPIQHNYVFHFSLIFGSFMFSLSVPLRDANVAFIKFSIFICLHLEDSRTVFSLLPKKGMFVTSTRSVPIHDRSVIPIVNIGVLRVPQPIVGAVRSY